MSERRAHRGRSPTLDAALALAWLLAKHEVELKMMKGQVGRSAGFGWLFGLELQSLVHPSHRVLTPPKRPNTTTLDSAPQSSIWYFLEAFCISALSVNVSIALTTGVLSAPVPSAASGANQPGGGYLPNSAAGAARGGAASRRGGGRRSDDGGGGASGSGGGGVGGALSVANEVQRQIVRGMLNRLSGTTGMQLINVNNVGIQLGGLDLSNRLVNQVGLAGLLVRHYTWSGLAEARKVLGGAGPGLLQIPGSVLWAGIRWVFFPFLWAGGCNRQGCQSCLTWPKVFTCLPHFLPSTPNTMKTSLVDLATEIAVRKRSPLQLPPALGHVSFTLVAQLVGVSARFLQALLAAMPVERQGPLSDHGLLQRYLQTPQTAGDAFYQVGGPEVSALDACLLNGGLRYGQKCPAGL